MAARKPIFSVETASISPITIGATTVTPQAQAVVLRLPFGGFVWNRPVRVLVERAGQVEQIPIVDVTRLAQVGMSLSLAAVAMVAARLIRKKETER